MDASTTLTATQVILVCMLLGFLLAWMITFAVLAFRSYATDADMPEGLTSPTHSNPVTSAPTMLQVIASQPVSVEAEFKRHDTSGEMETVSAI